MVEQSEQHITQAFAALADPTRRGLIEELSHGECRISDLAAQRRMSFAGVSKHVKVLEKAGLLTRRIEGRTHFLTLNAVPLRDAFDWLQPYRDFWQGSFDRLDALLKEEARQDSLKPQSSKE